MPYPQGTRPTAPIPLRLPDRHRSFIRSALDACLRGLRGDLAADHPHPDPERAEREAAAYERLLAGLDAGEIVPDSEIVGTVEKLADEIDAANQYEQVVAEHRALCGLLGQLAAEGKRPNATEPQTGDGTDRALEEVGELAANLRRDLDLAASTVDVIEAEVRDALGRSA